MSGFAAMVRLDGGPVDRAILAKLAETMRLRGPDGEQIRVDGSVGLVHTMFRTTVEAEHEVQPCTLDGSTWIAGDVRLDAREDLVRKLPSSSGGAISPTTPDSELVLHGYASWGEDCVQHLSGDFSFAIWDGPRQKLFCGRDQLGVRGMYYAKIGDTLLVSNSLRCVRSHPEVSDRFHDPAICDLLLFGYNQDNATTCFSDIYRLLPGHTLSWSKSYVAGQAKVSRYWTIPTEEPILYPKPQQYVDQFLHLVRNAITDRLRTRNLGIYLSGGLDSSLLAALTTKILESGSEKYDFRALTNVYDSLIPDQERYYAGLVASHLSLPIHFEVVDGYKPYERWYDGAVYPPQPVHEPFNVQYYDSLRKVAAHSRVVLYGEGPDNLLVSDGRRYLSYLLQHRRYGRAAEDLLRSFLAQPRLPIPRRWRRRLSRQTVSVPSFPDWIQPEMVTTYDLRERWQLWWNPPLDESTPRAASRTSMLLPPWQHLFERIDPDWGGVPIDIRLPYLDLRIVRFLLAVPSLPWCQQKFLLRTALKGLVPAEIRRRPKSPLSEDTFVAIRRNGWRHGVIPQPAELFRYITRMPDVNSSSDENIWLDSAPMSLSLWVSHARQIPISPV